MKDPQKLSYDFFRKEHRERRSAKGLFFFKCIGYSEDLKKIGSIFPGPTGHGSKTSFWGLCSFSEFPPPAIVVLSFCYVPRTRIAVYFIVANIDKSKKMVEHVT